jgi:hypothetical protein
MNRIHRVCVGIAAIGLLPGCESNWNGIWMVDFAEGVNVAGDCIDDAIDDGPSSNYAGPTGDQFEAVGIEHVGGWAAVSFHQSSLSFLAEVNGDEIKGIRTTGYEEGYRKPKTNGAWLKTVETKHILELTREGWTVEGSLQTTISTEDTEWRAKSTETSVYTCTTQWTFDGAKVEELD